MGRRQRIGPFLRGVHHASRTPKESCSGGQSWRVRCASFGPEGADAFYKGAIANEIVAAVREAGGVLTAADLAGYAPTERAPLETHHRGLRVLTMPPPSSGGVALIEALGILDVHYPTEADLARDGRGSSAYLHVLAEALKHAFADRARYLGDPDFVTVDVGPL